MDMSPGFHPIPAALRAEAAPESAADLWAEHGWALRGRDVASILAAVLLVSAILAVLG